MKRQPKLSAVKFEAVKEQIRWSEFVNWVFYGLVAYSVYDMTVTIKKLTESVSTLNTNVAVVVTELSYQKEAIRKVDNRLELLEKKQWKD
jgi:hypothetical protein